MLRFAIVFAILALIAGFLGYAGVANYSMDGARIFFFIFLAIALLSFLGSVFVRRRSA